MFILEIIFEFLAYILIDVFANILLSYPGAAIIWLFLSPKRTIRDTLTQYRFWSVALSIVMWTAVIFAAIKCW